jgi:hypothetical protein
MKTFSKLSWVPLSLALVKFVLPYLLQDPVYELHRDEYLYLAEGNHMSWGFMEVPPLLSVFSKLTHLLGDGFFWVKFWPSLFGALTVLVTCRLVTEMGGSVFAQVLASLCLICGVYMRVHFLFQPTPLEIFFWSLTALLITRYVKTLKPVYLYLIGISLGLSFLSKYSVLFFAAGILVGLALTPQRKILLQKHIYIAVGIALLIALPNIIWQYNHRWPVIHHMQELRESQLAFISPLDFIKDQFLMFLPGFFVWTSGLAWLLFSAAGKPFRLLAWIYITVIFLLIVSSGKNYYTIGAYPMLFAAGSVWLESASRVRYRWTRFASVAVMLILVIPFIPVALPIWKPGKLSAFYQRYAFAELGVLKWEDLKNHPLPQDFADMLGWKELAQKMSSVYQAMPVSERAATMVYCRNYGQAGALTYYGKGLPQVNTDNASFLLWMPDKYHVRHLLVVADDVPADDDIVFNQFESRQIIDSISNPLSREFGTKIILYRNGNDKVNQLIEQDIKEQKDQFRR